LDEEIICGPDIPLTIEKDKILGSGGSALVLRGEIKNNSVVSYSLNSVFYLVLFCRRGKELQLK